MLTRRLFIERVAALGGVTLAYETMTGLGLLEAAQHTPFQLSGRVNGTKVVVIGAGIAGLTIAYELNKLGYAVQVLEARSRPGGRAHTVRRGTVSEEDGPTQVCGFDEGLYFNCGAMRIAYHHETTIAYARELNVPVEVFAVASDNAYLYQTRAAAMTGKRVRLRQVRTDIDGYVSELLAKSLSQHALDETLTAADRERLMDHLRTVGRLNPQDKYTGNSTMRGPDDQLATDGTSQSVPMALSDLLGSRLGYQVDLSYEVPTDHAASRWRHGQLAARAGGEAQGPDHVSGRRARDPSIRTWRLHRLRRQGWQAAQDRGGVRRLRHAAGGAG